MNIKPLLGVVMFITSRYLAGAIEAEAKNRPLPFPSSPKFNISCISLPPESSMKAIIREDFVYYDFMRYKTTNKSEEPKIKITGFSSSCDTFFCSLFAIFTEERNLPTSKPFQIVFRKEESWPILGDRKGPKRANAKKILGEEWKSLTREFPWNCEDLLRKERRFPAARSVQVLLLNNCKGE